MPHIDIETHLAKTSEGFQEYIRTGLKNVSARDNTNTEKATTRSPLAENKQYTVTSTKKELPSIEELKQRVERAKALLNSTNDTH